jgi:pilus assembly protein Flp/PilA
MECFSIKTGKQLHAFIRDERGATAIEYGLIASGIFLAILLAVNNMASAINTMYGNIADNVNPAL